NAEKLHNLGFGLRGRRDHVLSQQSTRMGRAAIWIALSAIDHDRLSSVVLFEVNPAGIAVLEFKRDAPRPIHMDRIARGFEASQSMKIKAGMFISCGIAAASMRSRRRRIRSCIFASIFDVCPLAHSRLPGPTSRLIGVHTHS